MYTFIGLHTDFELMFNGISLGPCPATLLTSPCWLRPLAALARRAGVLSRPLLAGCAPVLRGGRGISGGGGGGGGVGSCIVGCVVGSDREVVLVLDLVLDDLGLGAAEKSSNNQTMICSIVHNTSATNFN
jgi:hypothetical protein